VPAASAGAPTPWKQITLEQHHGSLAAVLTVERRQAGFGAFEFRRMKLVVRNGGHTVFARSLCFESRCAIASHHSLELMNVWGDAAPEVILDTFTGGAHCCFESLVVLTDGGHAGHAISVPRSSSPPTTGSRTRSPRTPRRAFPSRCSRSAGTA
jgi:hypothetical protein